MFRQGIILAALINCENLFATPNVCSVVKTPAFNSCLELNFHQTTCGWPVPRPCVRINYFVPVSFVEVVGSVRQTHFHSLPGAKLQLSSLSWQPSFAAEDDHGSYSFHSHTVTVPFVSLAFHAMPCGGLPVERGCFEAMSEHFDWHWRTGKADLLQPKFLAWKANPKACLLKGAAMSATGETGSYGGGTPSCSFPVALSTFPPSSREICNGWGVLFPRSGTYLGASQSVAALMIADRIRSLGSEVLQTVPSFIDEKWQMISPSASACFRRGQNVSFLESAGMVNDAGRMSGKLRNYLFVIWKRVSCIKDIPFIASTKLAAAAMQSACRGF